MVTMEGDGDTDTRKVKMQKKRKMEDNALHDHSVIRKKKTAEKKEEKEAVINIGYKKRKRKESENDCIERDESSTGTNQGLANRQRKEIEHNELKPNKKKKKKRKYKEEAEDYIAADSPVPRKKQKKKKKKNEKVEVEETPESSSEHSFTHISSMTEKRSEREERIEEENLPFNTQHVFLKPLPVPEKRREKQDKQNSNIYRESHKESRKYDIEEGKQKKLNTYKSKRRKGMEGRGKEKEGKPKSSLKQKIPCEKSDEDQNTLEQEDGRSIKELSYSKWQTTEEDKHEQQSQSTDQQKVATRETEAPGITSRLAYSGLHGWQTDTSTDDLDFSDDEYHLSRAAIRSRLMEARRRPTVHSDVLYSEGEEVEGFVPDPRYSSDSPDSEWATAVDPKERLSPGFVVKQRNILTLEEAIYQFPPGVGVPPEEVEEVDDAENYWIVKERNLQTASYAEDAKEYIDAKIAHIEDYFKRLEKGQLDPSELKEMRPDNFDEPFYPTPRQLQFLNSLNIEVNWWLSDLHKYHLLNLAICDKSKAQWSDLNLFADTSRFTLREDKIIARNWFAFQKEYGFYDLRPLVSVRTARLVRQNGQLVVQLFEYLSHANKVHFLLYLAKDLPTRTLKHVNRRILKLLPFLRGRCLMRQSQRMTGSILAQLLYMTQLLGVDMVAAELLVGRALRSFYSRCFAVHIMLRDIKLRVGPWRQEEDDRFLRGLKEVLGVNSFVEAFRLRSVPWMAIFPYVRTRSIRYMRRRLIVLVSQDGVRELPATMRELMAKFIRLLHDEKVDDFSNLDWEEMARQVGAANPIRLVWSFRKFYFNYIPYQRRITVPEGLRYMHKHLLPFYEGCDPRRIPQPGDPDYQEHQHTHSLDAANLSSNPSHDLPNASHDPRNCGINSYDFSNEPSMASDMPHNPESNPHHDTESANCSVEPRNLRIDNRNIGQCNMSTSKTVGSSGSKEDNTAPGDYRNKMTATSAKGDQRNKRMISPNHEKHPKNIKKVNSIDSFGPTSLRKVRSNPQEPKTFRKVSSIQQRDVINLKKYLDRSRRPSSLSGHHHRYSDDPVACVAPRQRDENTFDFYNDSDNDDLTSSDSDVDDFELETLSQAVKKNLSYGRISR